jgi:hypothetical protein
MDKLAQLLESGGVGSIVAILLEKIPWFQQLDSSRKFWVAAVATIGSAIAFKAALVFIPEEIWAELNPWISVGIGSLVGSQLIHKLVNKDNKITLDEQTIQAIRRE